VGASGQQSPLSFNSRVCVGTIARRLGISFQACGGNWIARNRVGSGPMDFAKCGPLARHWLVQLSVFTTRTRVCRDAWLSAPSFLFLASERQALVSSFTEASNLHICQRESNSHSFHQFLIRPLDRPRISVDKGRIRKRQILLTLRAYNSEQLGTILNLF
jgi:hypothetical protein